MNQCQPKAKQIAKFSMDTARRFPQNNELTQTNIIVKAKHFENTNKDTTFFL